MRPKLLAVPGAEGCARRLAAQLDATVCRLESRRFPDGEIYLRIADAVAGCDVAVVADLGDPDPQLAGLLFVADALRELGAARVGLIAPYLPYMRQDRRFHAGEAITSRSFAKLISAAFDWLVTVDPHLHRHPSLAAIYTIPATAVASAPEIAAWVRGEIERPCLIGPDEESEQWVSEVAALAGCPWTVLRKERLGDREVVLELPDLSVVSGRTPAASDGAPARG